MRGPGGTCKRRCPRQRPNYRGWLRRRHLYAETDRHGIAVGALPLLIEGHTDGKGAHAYNMTLSDDRAGAVKKWLVDNGSIKASRITTRGWGETKPVAPNTKPDPKNGS